MGQPRRNQPRLTRRSLLAAIMKRVEFIPPLAGFLITTGLFVSYIISVQLGHVYPVLPYVSDTGVLQPEKTVFSVLLSVAGVLIGITMYLRYQQLAGLDGPTEVLSWNKKSAIPGSLATIGLCVVANCQEDLEHPSSTQMLIHIVAAITCFGAGILYGWYQSRITHALSTERWSRFVALSRYVCTLLTAFFFIATFPVASVAFSNFNGTFAEHMHWSPRDKGYVPHILSAASEYLMSFTYILFITTFYLDLRIQGNDQKSKHVGKEC